MRTSASILAVAFACAVLPLTAVAQVHYQATALPHVNPQNANSSAFALNGSGQAVGSSNVDPLTRRAVAWNSGSITVLTPNRTTATALGLNNSFKVVGQMSNLPNQPQAQTAFLWQGGQLTDLGDFPGGPIKSIARDINETGQIVGQGCTDEGCVAATWQGGVISSLGDLPGGPLNSMAFSINDLGEAVGQGVGDTSFGNFVPVLWQAGAIIELPTLPGSPHIGFAYDINNHGQIVGMVRESGWVNRAVLWQDQAIVALPLLPGFGTSIASAINDSGVIVGASNGPNGERAILWQNGTMTDLNDRLVSSQAPFIHLSNANDINELGQIVASGVDTRISTTAPMAFLLTPVP